MARSCELWGQLSGVEAYGWSYGSGHKVRFLNHIFANQKAFTTGEALNDHVDKMVPPMP